MNIDLSIPGWTSQAKLELFANISGWANQSVDHPRILELGSWAGRSLYAWAKNCPRGAVVSVDSSKGYTLTELKDRNPQVFPSMVGDPDKWNMWDTKIEDTRKHVTAELPNVVHYLCTSNEFFEYHCEWMDPFDLIFVDADHSESAVYTDIANGMRMLNRYGIVMGDDYGWDGVRLAVHRYADEHGLKVWNHSQSDVWALYSNLQHLGWWIELES